MSWQEDTHPFGIWVNSNNIIHFVCHVLRHRPCKYAAMTASLKTSFSWNHCGKRKVSLSPKQFCHRAHAKKKGGKIDSLGCRLAVTAAERGTLTIHIPRVFADTIDLIAGESWTHPHWE